MRGPPRPEPTTAVRRVVIEGRKTSVRLEAVMWDALADIAERKGRTIEDLLSEIDRNRTAPNRTAAIRAYVVAFYRGSAHAAAFSSEPAGKSGKAH
jgi:predicted DNA-binding ribbon-helix-helix protein